jgi:hypothetical protein
MTTTRAQCPRHLVVPGIAFPQDIVVAGSGLEGPACPDWSRATWVTSSRKANLNDALPQLIKHIAGSLLRW